jgi:peptidyl-prolyl cis-trans isomerase C
MAALLLITVLFQGMVFAEDAVVAKIGGEKVTVSDFNKFIGFFDSDKQNLIAKNTQLRESVLHQYVQSIAIYQFAEKKGFTKRQDIQDQLEIFRMNFLANTYLKKEIMDKITVSDSEVKEYYDKHKDEYKTPEMVKARHILVKVDPTASAEDKKKGLEKAEDILSRIKAGQDFAKLAAEFSDDPGSKSNGGELGGLFPRGRMVKPFEDAAFSLKPGEVSGIVETQFGYHIIKAEEKKEPGTEPFEKAKDRTRQKLIQEQSKIKVNEFIEKAMKEAGAETYPELIGASAKK